MAGWLPSQGGTREGVAHTGGTGVGSKKYANTTESDAMGTGATGTEMTHSSDSDTTATVTDPGPTS